MKLPAKKQAAALVGDLPVLKRIAGALAAIRSGVVALARAHRQTGRVRMMPIYDRTDVEWLDESGRRHRRIEHDWVGLAWYRNNELVHEVRWGRRGTGAALPHDRTE